MVSGFLIFPTKPIQRIKDSIDSRNIWDFLAAIWPPVLAWRVITSGRCVALSPWIFMPRHLSAHRLQELFSWRAVRFVRVVWYFFETLERCFFDFVFDRSLNFPRLTESYCIYIYNIVCLWLESDRSPLSLLTWSYLFEPRVTKVLVVHLDVTFEFQAVHMRSANVYIYKLINYLMPRQINRVQDTQSNAPKTDVEIVFFGTCKIMV